MIGHENTVKAKQITAIDALNAELKVLVSPEEGWDDHVLRRIEVSMQGYTPKHSHPWYHVNYIISGEGELMISDKITKIMKGNYAFIPANTLHQFRNVGNEPLVFLCIVPKEGHQ